MRIFYICFDYRFVVDGRSIFDRRYMEALRGLGYQVDEYLVDNLPRLVLPIWARNTAKIEAEIKNRSSKYDFVIVSHESLGRLASVLKPNLFIAHNLYSFFSFHGRPDVQALFRFRADSFFDEIFSNSKSVQLLSWREYQLAFSHYSGCNIIVEPPGIYVDSHADLTFNADNIKRSGSSSWLPKRLSLLSNSDLRSIELDGYEVIPESDCYRAFSIIEDRFLSGFKLKLIDSLYKGDVIASFSDLSSEVSWLGCGADFRYVKNVPEMLDYFKSAACENRSDFRILIDRRKWMEERYSWSSIVGRVISNVM